MNLRKTTFAGVAILLCSLFFGINFSHAEENTGVTSSTVTFGATFPLTGAASPGISSYYSGVTAYFDHVNANGGIYGRKLVFLNLDSQGLPTLAINSTNQLLLSSDSFALISNAPSCSNQQAVKSAVNPARRGVPNLFVDCYLEDVEDNAENVSTNYYSKLSAKNEITILKSYIDGAFPTQRIALVYQDDDNGLQISKLANDPKVICKKSFPAGTEFSLSGCNSTTTPIRDGDLVMYAGSPAGLARLILSNSGKLNLKYFVNYDAYNLRALQVAGLPLTSSTEIYTVSHNSLISETSNRSVFTFSEIGKRFAPTLVIDQRFLNGMNAAYIVASVMASVGADLTRERFMKAMDLFGSQFDVLGVSARSQNLADRFIPTGGVVVRNVGGTSEAISEVFSVVQNQVSLSSRKSIQISNNGLPQLTQLLPAPTPKPTPTPTPTPAPTPTPTPTPKPTAVQTQTPVVEIDGEDEEPFGKIAVKRDKTKYTISIISNLPNEPLQVRATKKGQKAIIYKVTTNDDGAAKFTTTRSLSGFQLVLLLDGEILSSVKAG